MLSPRSIAAAGLRLATWIEFLIPVDGGTVRLKTSRRLPRRSFPRCLSTDRCRSGSGGIGEKRRHPRLDRPALWLKSFGNYTGRSSDGSYAGMEFGRSSNSGSTTMNYEITYYRDPACQARDIKIAVTKNGAGSYTVNRVATNFNSAGNQTQRTTLIAVNGVKDNFTAQAASAAYARRSTSGPSRPAGREWTPSAVTARASPTRAPRPTAPLVRDRKHSGDLRCLMPMLGDLRDHHE